MKVLPVKSLRALCVSGCFDIHLVGDSFVEGQPARLEQASGTIPMSEHEWRRWQLQVPDKTFRLWCPVEERWTSMAPKGVE